MRGRAMGGITRIPCDAGETRLVKCRRYDASIEMERKLGCVVWAGNVVFMVAVRTVLVVVVGFRLSTRKMASIERSR